MLQYNQSDDAITFAVRVVPRASRSGVAGMHDGALRVRVAAPPVEGAANDELSLFLARALGVAPSAVEIMSGHASKNKRVRVHGADPTRLTALLKEAT
ncbi:MAG TPA: DUF167 domain-containing protein [Pyrinomonadaceae bacterium]